MRAALAISVLVLLVVALVVHMWPVGSSDIEPAAATIMGAVHFEGQPPRNSQMEVRGDKYCESHRDKMERQGKVVVNDDGTLRNVFVWIRKGVADDYPVPAEPVVVRMIHCQYVPRVTGIRVGQPLIIESHDPNLHYVHSMSKQNEMFSYAQAGKGVKNEQTFPHAELMVGLYCDVHGWMRAHVGVVQHPFFAVTGDGGTFELRELPPGNYTVEAWHEFYGTKEQTVTVGDNETKHIRFTFP